MSDPSTTSPVAPPDEPEAPPEEVVADTLPEEVVVEEPPRDYLDDLRRVQAEFENYRKRVAREQAVASDRGTEQLVASLLPVLDAGDLAIAHGDTGVEKVAGMLMETLAKAGLEGIAPAAGEAFDPTVHEAVAHEEGDTEHPEVLEMWRAGYRWKGRLLRPATVKVKG
ncbi:MAG TPA: nucleotide exchange factor GrpE [Acidimicrobiales bacterium]|nr:nucleotide exchange factor GrpE [Acidimicrobiales bacterium]